MKLERLMSDKVFFFNGRKVDEVALFFISVKEFSFHYKWNKKINLHSNPHPPDKKIPKNLVNYFDRRMVC